MANAENIHKRKIINLGKNDTSSCNTNELYKMYSDYTLIYLNANFISVYFNPILS